MNRIFLIVLTFYFLKFNFGITSSIKITFPESSFSLPTMHFSSVVFPQPRIVAAALCSSDMLSLFICMDINRYRPTVTHVCMTCISCLKEHRGSVQERLLSWHFVTKHRDRGWTKYQIRVNRQMWRRRAWLSLPEGPRSPYILPRGTSRLSPVRTGWHLRPL